MNDMTSEEFVKQRYPTANVEKYINGRIKGMQTAYYLCWSSIRISERGRLSEGTSKSNAWKNAKQNIIEQEASVVNPDDLEGVL